MCEAERRLAGGGLDVNLASREPQRQREAIGTAGGLDHDVGRSAACSSGSASSAPSARARASASVAVRRRRCSNRPSTRRRQAASAATTSEPRRPGPSTSTRSAPAQRQRAHRGERRRERLHERRRRRTQHRRDGTHRVQRGEQPGREAARQIVDADHEAIGAVGRHAAAAGGAPLRDGQRARRVGGVDLDHDGAARLVARPPPRGRSLAAAGTAGAFGRGRSSRCRSGSPREGGSRGPHGGAAARRAEPPSRPSTSPQRHSAPDGSCRRPGTPAR